VRPWPLRAVLGVNWVYTVQMTSKMASLARFWHFALLLCSLSGTNWGQPCPNVLPACSTVCPGKTDPFIEACRARCTGGTPAKNWQCYQRCLVNWPGCSTLAAVYPKYYVLTLLYAPPGCKGNTCSPSSVVYGSSSSTGTTTSIENSFTAGTSLTLSATESIKLDKEGPDIGLKHSDSFEFSATGTSGSSQTISRTGSRALTVKGDDNDGVDHQQDTFEILLNPEVVVQAQKAAKDRSGRVVKDATVIWTLSSRGATPFAYHLSVQELTMLSNSSARVADSSYPCPAVSSTPPVWTVSQDAECQQLKKLNFTHADYATILDLNPFVKTPSPTDVFAKLPNRFVATTWSWEYISRGAYCKFTDNSSISNALQSQVTSSYKTQYKMDKTDGVTLPLLGVSLANSWTWTSSASVVNTSNKSNSATATLACPSTDYTLPNGNTFLIVYWDTLYGSFLFVPASVPPNGVISRGHLTSTNTQSATRQPVELLYNGNTYRTTTDEQGNYAMYLSGVKHRKGQAMIGQLTIGNSVQPINLESAAGVKMR